MIHQGAAERRSLSDFASYEITFNLFLEVTSDYGGGFTKVEFWE